MFSKHVLNVENMFSNARMSRATLKFRVLNGGPIASGRNISSQGTTIPHLVDTIEFIHTPLWKDKNFLAQRYVTEGRSISQIAAETLSSKAAVRDALLEFGFKLKGQGKPGLRPSQLPYGYRMSDGLMVAHLGEQRVIASVKKMVNDGLSYRKVCEFLTSVGVPTKNKGKSWQPEMIRRLLSR